MPRTDLPFAIEPERVIQTHANVVLLKGDRAYKLKKPVKFPFLDYSTLERRRQMILNELHLNRHFSPEFYLGVAEVSAASGGLEIGPLREDLPEHPESDVVDYAVVMRRIADDAWLPARVSAGEVSDAQIITLMEHLIRALRAAPGTDEVKATGLPDHLRNNTVANIAECEQFVPQCLTRERWQRLDALLHGWFEAHHEVFEARVAADRIREGHGDLKPGNIAFVDGRPVITDCIEFNPLYRRLDTLAEVAFLATGLESLGAFDMAAHVLSAYRRTAQDDYPEALRRYYQAHLACVMAKVQALQLREPEVPHAQKDQVREQATRNFALADFHAREPHVIVVMGIMGCGKSTVAEAVGAHFGWPVMSSDIERKRLCGVAASERLPQAAYSHEVSARVYEALFQAVGRAGSGIVLDAQFGLSEARTQAVRAAAQAGGHTVVIHCDAPDAVVRERMRRRAQDPSRVSDATADLLQDARTRFQAPSAGERLQIIPFDTRHRVLELVTTLQAALTAAQ